MTYLGTSPAPTPAPRLSTRRGRWSAALAVALAAGMVPAAAALIGPGTAGAAVAAGQRTRDTAPDTRPPCHRPTPAPTITSSAVPGSTTDYTITSFDGTQIRAHWFPVTLAGATSTSPGQQAAPTILEGPGWGEPGDVSLTAPGGFGIPSIDQLHQAGYNVLTWDPRGWGASTGTVETDSAQYEGRDVSALLDWLATRPGVVLDGPGDPRVGMVGGSYGGGIQFAAASVDCRIDALVPTIAWHSLVTSLDKANTVKMGWSNLLFSITGGHHIDPHITQSHVIGQSAGQLPADDVAWFTARGGYVVRDDVPTLIMQGTVDNLFTLDEGVENYENLRSRGVPAAMMWFCGGHGVCLTNPGNQQLLTQATFDWLDRYVKGDTKAPTFPRFQFVDQNGVEYHAADFPLPLTAPFTATGSGTLTLVAGGGSGPAHPPADSPDPLAGIAGIITPARATNAVNVVIPTGSRTAVVIGAPRLTLTYEGSADPGSLPTRVYAQLVDDHTGVVLGNQITPIDVTLDGRAHTTTVPLEMVVYHATPGQHVTLQLVATTVAYGPNRLGGHVHFSHIAISLPVAAHP